MIAPMVFVDDFIDFLERKAAGEFKLKGFDGENNKEIYKRPKVVKGFLLPKISDNSQVSELPYICFRIIKLETIKVSGKNIQCLKTGILFGCYCSGIQSKHGKQIIADDGSGYRDLWNIMERTRQALFNGTYNPKVRLFEDTFSMEVPEEQYYPVWEGRINADFLIGTPEWGMSDSFYKPPKPL